MNDYVGATPGATLKSFLITLSKGRTLVICWDRAAGFSLPTKKQRRLFAELAGIPIPGAGGAGPGRGMGGSLAAGLNQFAQAQRGAGGPGTDLVDLLSQIRRPEEALTILSRVLHARPEAERLQQQPDEEQEEGKIAQEQFRVAVIIDYAETIVPAAEAAASESDRQALVQLASWGRDATIGDQGHILYFITNDLHDVNERLRKPSARLEPIQIPFPTLEERASFVKRLLADTNLQVKLAPDTEMLAIARLTTGLRYIDLEDVVLRANFQGQPLSLALVKERKDEIMASEFEEVLSIEEHEYGFEALGGMEDIKNDLRATVIAPMRSGQLRLVPQGLLLMGPAGTGKTRLARALAKEAGVTFVELQLARIYSRWVGDTERRLERALEAISAWRHCIVFIDEIDQAMSRGESGDTGVSNRVFKRLMEFMADTTLRGHVLFIAASNRPDLLDAALLRPGRLDKKIPVLPPGAEERAAILSVLTRAAFPGEEQTLPDAETYQRLAEQMEGYTGAEIEGIVGKSAQLLARVSGPLSIADALQIAYERILPTTQQIEAMTRLALQFCNDLVLVPSDHRALARALRHPQAKPRQAEEDQTEEPGQMRRHPRRDW